MSLLAIYNSICDDVENGEHINSAWIKDTFDINGYSIIKHDELADKDKTIEKLEAKLKQAAAFIKYSLIELKHNCKELGLDPDKHGFVTAREAFLEEIEGE